jgi:peptidoglycan/LPS O-acetylase OafA/YrhL
VLAVDRASAAVDTTVEAPVAPPVAPTEEARLPHRPALDGLRGLAVVAVLGYHLGLSWLEGGFLGVSLFFTLSGFLITNLLLARRDGPKLKDFWARRARRLLPAALVGIALAIAATAVAGTSDQLAQLPGDVLGALVYSANWRFVLDHSSYAAGYQAPSALLHYWSLAIEEQAYVILPLLVVVVGCVRRRLAVVVAGLIALSCAATLILGPAQANRIYLGTDTRAEELLAGVLLAVLVGFPRTDRIPRWLGAVALAATLALWATVSQSAGWLYRGGLWAVSIASAALILAALGTGLVSRLLTWRPLVELGRRSYGVYVYHWPLFVMLDGRTTGLSGVALDAVQLGATAVVAGASFRWLEQPIRERRVRPPVVVIPVAMAVLLIGAVLVSGAFPQRAVASTSDGVVLSGPLPSGRVTPARVLFVGDSLMHEAYPTISARLGAQTEVLGGPGQSLMTKQAVWLPGIRQAVATFDPDVVVLESCCGAFRFDPPWPGTTAQYDAVWRSLALQATELASARGAVVLWALAPPMHTNGWYGAIDGEAPVINGIYRSIAACSPGVGTIDWGLISGPGRTYAAALPDQQGRLVTVRDTDGFHFTPAGWAAQARVTVAGIDRAWTGHRVQPFAGC